MRVLFDNLVVPATLTTDEPNESYPVTNLAHPFLRRKYQSVASPAIITVTFAGDSTVDCLFYGWHNLTSLIMRLYNSGDALLDTITVASPESGVGSEFFTAVPAVAYAEVEIAGTVPYLGGLGIGEYYELPRPIGDFSEGLDDRGVVVASTSGQAQQLYVEPLKTRNYTLQEMTRATRAEVAALMLTAGIGRPLWLDAFYLDHDYESPMYCRIVREWVTTKNGRRYDARSIEFKEMR